jgi:hypothetical protein
MLRLLNVRCNVRIAMGQVQYFPDSVFEWLTHMRTQLAIHMGT